jgi:ankyrin repeat protein
VLSFIKNIFKGALHKACEKGNIEAVKQHLAAGAYVNVRDMIRRTPLYFAAMKGHKEVAELLIANGADVNAENLTWRTPLLVAAIRGHKEIAELLIANGADVNAKDENGWTPLVYAKFVYKRESPDAKAAKKETADLLRKHGGKTGEELKAEGK